MESTDAELPGLDADYAPADFSGAPVADAASDAIGADVGSDTGTGDCSTDSGGDTGGTDAGARMQVVETAELLRTQNRRLTCYTKYPYT